MSEVWSSEALRVVQIIWLDLLLSGDNAVVIALASRRLPPDGRRLASALGAGAAVALRIVFAVLLLRLLQTPWLQLVGAGLLLWIAVRLTDDPGGETEDVAAAESVWAAVRIIAFADALMSLDNVLAITAAAQGNAWLVIFGLLVSLPLVVFGAALFMKVLARWPWLLWVSAALVGWSAGQMAVHDLAVSAWAERIPAASISAGAAGAAIVLLGAVGRFSIRRLKRRKSRP